MGASMKGRRRLNATAPPLSNPPSLSAKDNHYNFTTFFTQEAPPRTKRTKYTP